MTSCPLQSIRNPESVSPTPRGIYRGLNIYTFPQCDVFHPSSSLSCVIKERKQTAAEADVLATSSSTHEQNVYEVVRGGLLS